MQDPLIISDIVYSEVSVNLWSNEEVDEALNSLALERIGLQEMLFFAPEELLCSIAGGTAKKRTFFLIS
jgi:hypothetical protein